MILIYDNKKPEKQPLVIAQMFVNIQTLTDGKLDNFTQLSLKSDQNYSNFNTVREFFMDGQTNPSYKIIEDSNPDKILLYLENGIIKNIGINALTLTPRIVVDFNSVNFLN